MSDSVSLPSSKIAAGYLLIQNPWELTQQEMTIMECATVTFILVISSQPKTGFFPFSKPEETAKMLSVLFIRNYRKSCSVASICMSPGCRRVNREGHYHYATNPTYQSRV